MTKFIRSRVKWSKTRAILLALSMTGWLGVSCGGVIEQRSSSEEVRQYQKEVDNLVFEPIGEPIYAPDEYALYDCDNHKPFIDIDENGLPVVAVLLQKYINWFYKSVVLMASGTTEGGWEIETFDPLDLIGSRDGFDPEQVDYAIDKIHFQLGIQDQVQLSVLLHLSKDKNPGEGSRIQYYLYYANASSPHALAEGDIEFDILKELSPDMSSMWGSDLFISSVGNPYFVYTEDRDESKTFVSGYRIESAFARGDSSFPSASFDDPTAQSYSLVVDEPWLDKDCDNILDCQDEDDDNNGVKDSEQDSDFDGITDNLDIDDDNDGILDWQGQIHLGLVTFLGRTLEYAWINNLTMEKAVVFDSPFGEIRSVSMVTDNNGHPHMAVVSQKLSNEDVCFNLPFFSNDCRPLLKYFRCDGSGQNCATQGPILSKWHDKELDGSGGIRGKPVLAVDDKGLVHIAYEKIVYDSDGGVVKSVEYKQCDTNKSNCTSVVSPWKEATILESSDYISNLELKVDSNGNVWIATSFSWDRDSDTRIQVTRGTPVEP